METNVVTQKDHINREKQQPPVKTDKQLLLKKRIIRY
jgi:hypothetical protein